MDQATKTTTDTERPHLDCEHCRYARQELEAAKPLTPRGAFLPWGDGAIFVANGPMSRGLDTCACDCHDIWRFFTKTPVAS